MSEQDKPTTDAAVVLPPKEVDAIEQRLFAADYADTETRILANMGADANYVPSGRMASTPPQIDAAEASVGAAVHTEESAAAAAALTPKEREKARWKEIQAIDPRDAAELTWNSFIQGPRKSARREAKRAERADKEASRKAAKTPQLRRYQAAAKAAQKGKS